MATKTQIALPRKLIPVFAPPRGAVRYRGAYGGRGSGKSFSFAKMAAVWGYAEPLRILCTREFQASIKESFHAELKNAINSEEWLAAHYGVGVDFLRGDNGTEFIFKGLRNNIQSIKSLAQIDLCIVEEAEDIPETSWLSLEPTIRAPKSEIWPIWNPCSTESPVDTRFRKKADDSMIIAELNYQDNPRFPKVLEQQRQRDEKNLSPETYAHVWDGEYLVISEAQVFANKFTVKEFEPTKLWDGPYYGLDFGFSTDPSAGNKSWIYEDDLYIEYEFYEYGMDIDDMPDALIEALPGVEKHTCRADNARPESISYLRRNGVLGCKPCKKGKGSIEDGVEKIKSFRNVYIHPRCIHTKNEFMLYSYKTDRLTGDVLPIIIDANNHSIDSLRYALEPVQRGGFDYGSLL